MPDRSRKVGPAYGIGSQRTPSQSPENVLDSGLRHPNSSVNRVRRANKREAAGNGPNRPNLASSCALMAHFGPFLGGQSTPSHFSFVCGPNENAAERRGGLSFTIPVSDRRWSVCCLMRFVGVRRHCGDPPTRICRARRTGQLHT